MKNYGLTSIHEFLDDFIVYRNLTPMDSRLPGLADIRAQIGLETGSTPRKSEPAYAAVIAHLLRAARTLDAPHTPIAHLIYVGDTRLNDGHAFQNLCNAGSWQGLAFIGSENEKPQHIEIIETGGQTLYLSNRWLALRDFDRFCRNHAFPIDERTAIILDLDKTTLGARGRNDHVINQARVAAVRQTVASLLGESFNPESFESAYTLLNQTTFHPFTTDNQDYLAYICLIVGSGLIEIDALVNDIRTGVLKAFVQFINQVNAQAEALPDSLRQIHESVYGCVQQGDPTPFKAFRYNEYQTTTARMGSLDAEAPAAQCLEQEITITQEVREIALQWKATGALLFGLSDKPDEASTPALELAAQGCQPIHRVKTHAIGN